MSSSACGGDDDSCAESRVYGSDEGLPTFYTTPARLNGRWSQPQALPILWDTDMYIETIGDQPPTKIPAPPFHGWDTLTVTAQVRGDVTDRVETHAGSCPADSSTLFYVPVRLMVETASGAFREELDALINAEAEESESYDEGRLLSVSLLDEVDGPLGEYLDSIAVPNGTKKGFSLWVRYTDEGDLSSVSLNVYVGDDPMNIRSIFTGNTWLSDPDIPPCNCSQDAQPQP
ncbi:MAG: hypothetical protein QM778_18595 [Myxococcales bacterium]